MARRYWFAATLGVVAAIAALGAAFELSALSAQGGSILPLLSWAVIWLASAGMLGWRLLRASRRSGRDEELDELAEALPVEIALFDGEGELSRRNEAMRQAVPDPAKLGSAESGRSGLNLSAAARSAEGDAHRLLLLVDDSATNRSLASAILKKMGYAVTAVESGPQAVEEASRGGYAAVLMDIWMPDMDGFEATTAIRALPAPHCDVPVIAMTAHTGPDERRKCFDAGMDEHVGKPIDRVVLARILDKLTGSPADRSNAGGTVVDETAKSDRLDMVSDEILEQLRNDAGPALVNELIGAYMAETDERLGRIESALKAGNLEDIGADSHSMKSSSGTFGAITLQALAARLESAAKRGDVDGVAAIQEELPGLVSETWAAFAARGIRQGKG